MCADEQAANPKAEVKKSKGSGLSAKRFTAPAVKDTKTTMKGSKDTKESKSKAKGESKARSKSDKVTLRLLTDPVLLQRFTDKIVSHCCAT